MKKLFTLCLIAASLSFTGCKKGGLNIFTIEDDKEFGLQMEAEIAKDPAQYPVLPRNTNAQAYAYLDNMRNTILNSGQLEHKDDFVWKLYIIKDDATQNAFCTPGGYIYIYTGLIKYLDNASSLAGVMGHEMAHADRRHSTEQMTKEYGLSTLIAIVLGEDQSSIAGIAANLTLLAFSRDHEKDADKHSVMYLCPTEYRADGAADFFQKIIDSGAPQPPAFLSTHPSPDNRVANIRGEKTTEGCNGSPSGQLEVADYAAFKALLP